MTENKRNIVFKKGKRAFKKDKRDLLWRDYTIKAVLPSIPKPPFGHIDLVKNWDMLANDRLGDCVIAGSCHSSMLDNAEGGKTVTFTDDNAIDAYSQFCGYNPNDPNSDQGCEIREVLSQCRKVGLKDSEGNIHKIDAYVSLDQTSLQELYESIFLFGKAKLGIQVPQSAIDQFNAGQPWVVVPNSPILGGHDVEAIGIDKDNNILVVTWGTIQKMSLEFYQSFCDEAWAPLSKEMLTSQGKSLEGFDWEQLTEDLAAINQGSSPIPPTPAPVRVPTHLVVHPITAIKKHAVVLSAELIDTQSNSPIGGRLVSFSVKTSTKCAGSVGNATTAPNGTAVISYIPKHRGSHVITAKFAGDDKYEYCIGSNIITVNSKK